MDVLSEFGTSADFGLDWPTWIAVGGFGLFCLLACYATLLLVAGKHLPARFRLLQLPTLRGRMLVGFVLAATLPAISLALVLSERTTSERLDTTSTILTSQAETIVGMADFFLQRYINELTDAASAIQPLLTAGDDSITQPMIDVHQMTTGILLMIAADADGRVIATTRKTAEAVIATDVHAATTLRKDYFVEPMRTGTPYISDGLSDPEGRFPLAAAISVPVFDSHGATVGVLMGFYDLASLSRAQSPLAERNGIRSVMFDRAGKIMFAARTPGIRFATVWAPRHC